MAERRVGIDYGTSGAKAFIIDSLGTVPACAFGGPNLIQAQPGWFEHDAERYWPIACPLGGKILSDGDTILIGFAAEGLPGYQVPRKRTEYIEPIEPDAKTHRVYEDCFQLYKKLYEHTRDDSRKLSVLPTVNRDGGEE